jgi:tripartite-type tricarboxylate transporter receptor subunit TctC
MGAVLPAPHRRTRRTSRPPWPSATALLSILALATTDAFGADAGTPWYPSKPVRFIVANAPGGGADMLARAIAQKLAEKLKQPVVVDNRPGAGGIVGTEVAARAPGDGHTIVMIATNHTVNPSLYKTLPYDALGDFEPVTQVTASPNVLIVHPSLPARSVKELIAIARRSPGALNFSSAGNGTAGHLAAELMKVMAKIDVVHVPYKAAPQALADLVSGQVQLQFSNLMAAMPQMAAAKVRPLAVTTEARSPAVPNLPTMAEAGLPGYRVDQTFGVLAPGKTSAAIVERLSAEIAQILKLPEVRQRLVAEGAVPVGSTPQQYRHYLAEELQKWAKVARAINLKAD